MKVLREILKECRQTWSALSSCAPVLKMYNLTQFFHANFGEVRGMRKVPSSIVFMAFIAWLGHAFMTEAQNQTADRKTTVLQRPPARFIKDPNPSLAAVAVNSEHDMLVVVDENMFQILEYGTKENTPATAKFSEPRRVISGTMTRAEMICDRSALRSIRNIKRSSSRTCAIREF